MDNAPDASRSARLASIPLAVAYAAIPLGTGLLALTDSSPLTAPFLPWLVLAGLGCIWAMLFRSSRVPVKKRFLFEVALFLLLVVALVQYGWGAMEYLETALPYIREAVPLVMVLFCFLWVRTFGLPDRGDLQRYGAVLGVLCVVDLVAEVVMYGAVPAVRWIGNADVLAGLLLVSMCAGLRPGDNEGGVYEPDQGNAVWRGLVMVGLIACLSRTGLFGAAWVILCFGRGKKRYRIAYAVLCVLLMGVTFFLPVTSTSAVRYIDYWLWVEAIRLFSENTSLLFTGFSVPYSLPVELPLDMSPIWEAATGLPSMLGVYLTQVPSFWLRLTMGWGLGVPLALLLAVFVLLLRRLTRMGAGLTAALFTQGMSTPLLFEPALGVAVAMGFLVAMSKPGVRPNVRRTVPESDSGIESEPIEDAPSPREWDMRPL